MNTAYLFLTIIFVFTTIYTLAKHMLSVGKPSDEKYTYLSFFGMIGYFVSFSLYITN